MAEGNGRNWSADVKALGDSIVAYGRTLSGIPFGAPMGELTDIFFLVCCRDDRTHLRVLARLTRLIMRPGFLDELRNCETAVESYEKIIQPEQMIGVVVRVQHGMHHADLFAQ